MTRRSKKPPTETPTRREVARKIATSIVNSLRGDMPKQWMETFDLEDDELVTQAMQDVAGWLERGRDVVDPLGAHIRVPGRRRVMRPQGPITIASRFPFEITGQCNTRLRISGAPRRRIEGVVRLMLILHGILLTPTA